MSKLLVVCGPTATGKTDLALTLAQKYPADLVSADSRQVYQGMDIGTGKDIPPNFARRSLATAPFTHYTDAHTNIYGYDLVTPNQEFSLSHYIQFGQAIIKHIWHQHRLPILVGGTGLYINGVIQPPATAFIPQNTILRQQLETASVKALQNKLQQVDASKFKQMNQSDKANPRRLIRALEIAAHKQHHPTTPPAKIAADVLIIGLTLPLNIIDQHIKTRVQQRIEQGFIQEVQSLDFPKLDPHLPAAHTPGYSQIAAYLNGDISLPTATAAWIKAEQQYARRQLVWFKKQAHIHWFTPSQPQAQNRIVSLVDAWYSQNA